MMELLPSPTPDELRAMRTRRGWSASHAAAMFWLSSGRRWRELESGERRMDEIRWTLGLLSIDEHDQYVLAER